MNNNRHGMQLLELVISLASASVLMAGLSSSIIIANQSMKLATTRQATSAKTQLGLDRLRYDLAEAFGTTGRSTSGVTLSVGDRNGDGLRETVQYRWPGGAGAPLQSATNAGPWRDVTENLSSFQMNWHQSSPYRLTTAGGLDPVGASVYQSHTLANRTLVNSLSIPLPATYVTGDLLVAAVAVNSDALAASTPAGWQAGPRLEKGSVTLLTYYSHGPAGSALSLNWSNLCAVYGVVAHFTVPAGALSLVDAQVYENRGTSPEAPAATATVNNALVVRMLAGTKGLSVLDDACNMSGHVSIALRKNLLVDPVVGMTYRYSGAGSVPAARFNLDSEFHYAAATLVFQP